MDLKDLRSQTFDFRKFLIPPHPLTKYEIQKYYPNKKYWNYLFRHFGHKNKKRNIFRIQVNNLIM